MSHHARVGSSSREHFEKDDAVDVVDRLGEVKAAQPYMRTNFLAIMRAQQSQEPNGVRPDHA